MLVASRLGGSVFVALLLSGCAGDSVGPKGSTSDGFGAGATVIEVLVIDPELVPIVGATGTLDGSQNVTSDASGLLRFSDVEPGSHALDVEAYGFTGVNKSVDASEGERTFSQVQLQPIPGVHAYTELIIHTGLEACGFAAGVQGGTGKTMENRYGIPCQFGEPNTSYLMNVSADWAYLVMEMEWQTRDTMWFLATHEAGICNTGGEDVCWAQSMGYSPLRLEGAPGSLEHARRYALDGKKTFPTTTFDLIADAVYTGMFREEINDTAGDYCNVVISAALATQGQSWNPSLGCGLGYGYSTGYKFTYYTSIFHVKPPLDPASYSGRPDA